MATGPAPARDPTRAGRQTRRPGHYIIGLRIWK
jgi:hypothetical protein